MCKNLTQSRSSEIFQSVVAGTRSGVAGRRVDHRHYQHEHVHVRDSAHVQHYRGDYAEEDAQHRRLARTW